MEALIGEIKQINWPKNLLHFAFYVVMLFLLFLVVMQPGLTRLKESNINYRKAEFLHQKTQGEYQERQRAMSAFGQTNQKVLTGFASPFLPEAFEKEAQSYFERFKIRQLGAPLEENGMVARLIEIEATLKSTADYYGFLAFLNSSGNIIEAEFPIRFHSERDKVHCVMALKVYTRREGQKSDSGAMPEANR